MGFFSRFFGSKGGGGTRDAFQQYKNYVAEILPQFERMFAEQKAAGQGQENPFVPQLTQPFEGLEGSIDAIQQRADAIPAALQRSALASTLGSQVGAVQAARTAAGGRGGLAFSGGAAAIAARAGQEAATQQSAALSNALLQGELAGLEAAQTGAGLRLQLAGARSGARAQQASLAENRFNTVYGQEAAFRQQLIAGLFGLGQTGIAGGLAGQSALGAGTAKKSSILGFIT